MYVYVAWHMGGDKWDTQRARGLPQDMPTRYLLPAAPGEQQPGGAGRSRVGGGEEFRMGSGVLGAPWDGRFTGRP